MITFRIDVAPRGKGRPRFGRGHAFTDPKTKAYETAVAFAARVAMAGRQMLDGPIHLHLTAFMPIPQSWSKKKQDAAVQGIVRPTTTPDADNVLKALADSCNGIVWKDDAQIVEATIVKQYSTSPALVVVARPA